MAGQILKYFEIEVADRQLGANHPATAGSLFNLAALYHSTQRPTDALTAIQRAISIYTETPGKDHPTTQAALRWLELIRAANLPNFSMEYLLKMKFLSP